jgi:hypothetical protein
MENILINIIIVCYCIEKIIDIIIYFKEEHANEND